MWIRGKIRRSGGGGRKCSCRGGGKNEGEGEWRKGGQEKKRGVSGKQSERKRGKETRE